MPHRESAVKEWLLARSMLLGHLDYSLQVGRLMIKMAREGSRPVRNHASPPLSPANAPKAWRIAVARVDRLRDRVIESGGRLVIVHTGGSDETGARIRAHAARRGIPFIDQSGPLERGGSDGTPMLLPGDPHDSPQGHTVVANAVLDFIRDGGLLESAPAVASNQPDSGGERR